MDKTRDLSVHLSGVSFNTRCPQVREVQTQLDASPKISRELMWNLGRTLSPHSVGRDKQVSSPWQSHPRSKSHPMVSPHQSSPGAANCVTSTKITSSCLQLRPHHGFMKKQHDESLHAAFQNAIWVDEKVGKCERNRDDASFGEVTCVSWAVGDILQRLAVRLLPGTVRSHAAA